jgi:transcriptional regulator with XRE-family HTH domain
MSRKHYTSEDFEFAADFGNKLDDAIDAHDLTRDEAADRLHIHRSMLFRYLGGKSIPGSKILQRACEELGVIVDYRGIRLDADYFKADRVTVLPRPSPVQLELSSIREFLNGKHAQVSIRRKKGAAVERLEITMTLRLGTRKRRDSRR